MNNFISIDAASSYIKFVTEKECGIVPSNVVTLPKGAKQLKTELQSVVADEKSHVLEVAGVTYLIGERAKSMMNSITIEKNKDNNKATVRALMVVAKIAQETGMTDFNVVVLNPIDAWEHVDSIKARLEGFHEVTLNLQTVKFNINVNVMFEGITGAFAINSNHTRYAILDVGSTTQNFVQFHNNTYDPISSGTKNNGYYHYMDDLVNQRIDYDTLIEDVKNELQRLLDDNNPVVYLLTGDNKLNDMLGMENVKYPVIEHNGLRVNTTFANAVGAYNIMRLRNAQQV